MTDAASPRAAEPAAALVLRLLLSVALVAASGCAGLTHGLRQNLRPAFPPAAQAAVTREPEPLPEMATDRPDFTESSGLVPAGHLQVEAGYTFFRRDDEATRTAHGYPEALARLGVIRDRLELRVGQSLLTTSEPGAEVPAEPPAHRTGNLDLYLGAKVGLGGQRKARPEMALVVQTTVPTGADGFTAGRAIYGLNFLYAWEAGRLSVGASTQGNLTLDDADEGYLGLTQSVSVGYDLSASVGAYAEWFAAFPAGSRRGVTAAHAVDGGVTVKIAPWLQWDARVGKGLTGGADRFFAGSGLAVRY